MLTTSPERVEAILQDLEERYNPDLCLLGGPMYGAGYHTTLAAGTPVHLPRESASYAVQLLAADMPDRANDIIQAVCQLQDRNPNNKTCGIWSWSYEEPLSQMSPPDWNWADFIGASLATALGTYANSLKPDVAEEAQNALRFAAEAIQRRNVGPGYTNIAILGGGVCAMAGELLDRKDLLDYGRQRLQACVHHRAEHGSFNEYNSPTYTMVVVDETERFLAVIQDPETREAAENLNSHAWEVIATHYHPPTRQWAGPHARTYSDTLQPGTLARLSLRVGINLFETDDEWNQNAPNLVWPVRSCPEQWQQHFTQPLNSETTVRLQVAAPQKNGTEARVATTYFNGDACIGTINHDTLWTQRRGVIAYAKTETGETAVFRLRFLHNEHDFASGWLVTQQEGPKISASISVIDGHGDFHPSLDKPEDGIFKGKDWNIRLELTAPNATIAQNTLIAAPYAIQIQKAEGQIANAELEWSSVQEDGVVAWVGHPKDIGEDLFYDQLKKTNVSIQLELTKK